MYLGMFVGTYYTSQMVLRKKGLHIEGDKVSERGANRLAGHVRGVFRGGKEREDRNVFKIVVYTCGELNVGEHPTVCQLYFCEE